MAVIQSNFGETIAQGFPGAPANGELSNDISLNLEGATACAFGRPVYQGTADEGATLVVSAALRGFALRSQTLPETTARPVDSYAPGDTMAVRERGVLHVTSTTAAAKNGQVYVTPAGAISNSASGNTAATGWLFDQTLAAAGIVMIARR
jgi:hypothetical protein